MKDLCSSYRTSYPKASHSFDDPTPRTRIAIIYSSVLGGGHKAVAKAIEEFLKTKKITVLSLDINAFEAPYSEKIINMSAGACYSKYMGTEGNTKRASIFYHVLNVLQRPEDRCYIRDLRETIVSFGADHIFNTLYAMTQFSAISFQTAISQTIVHTDHRFNAEPILKQLFLEKHTQGSFPLISFTTANEYPEFFSQLSYLQDYKDWICPMMIPLGIPARDEFQLVSEEEKCKLRESQGIPSDALVCTVAAGYFGMESVITTLITKIQEEAELFSNHTHIFAITGANVAINDKIKRILTPHPNLTITLKNFLNAEEMALCMKLSDVLITKPGGSTTAEAIQMKKKVLFLITPQLPFEEVNSQILEKLGLGKRLNSMVPLAIQMKQLLAQPIQNDLFPKISWQSNLERFLQRQKHPEAIPNTLFETLLEDEFMAPGPISYE